MKMLSRAASVITGLFLALVTAGWTGPGQTVKSATGTTRAWLHPAHRIFRRMALLLYVKPLIGGGGQVIDLLSWKRMQPWRTLHFALSGSKLTRSTPDGKGTGEPLTVAVTSQVRSIKALRLDRVLNASGELAHHQQTRSSVQGARQVTAVSLWERRLRRNTHASRRANTGLRIASVAMSLLGKPYLWGGNSPAEGFDCSGLVEYVLRQVGIAAPRTSWQQFGLGKEISASALQPGDLLFFSTYANGPSHVGIYVGNERFVNALNPSSGVILSTLQDTYFARHLVGVRSPWQDAVATR